MSLVGDALLVNASIKYALAVVVELPASNTKSPESIGTETSSISTFHLLVIPSEIVGGVAYNQAKSETNATGGVV